MGSCNTLHCSPTMFVTGQLKTAGPRGQENDWGKRWKAPPAGRCGWGGEERGREVDHRGKAGTQAGVRMTSSSHAVLPWMTI